MRSAVCYHTYPIVTLMIPLTHLITSSHPFLAHLWPFRTRTASCSWASGSVSSWLNWMDHASERFMFRVSDFYFSFFTSFAGQSLHLSVTCLKHKREAYFCNASGDVFLTGL